MLKKFRPHLRYVGLVETRLTERFLDALRAVLVTMVKDMSLAIFQILKSVSVAQVPPLILSMDDRFRYFFDEQ